MKFTVPSAIFWAALSQPVLGQYGEEYGMVNLSGPDINDAYPAASVCTSLKDDSPKSVEVIQIQASPRTQCTFYSNAGCEDEQTTLGTGGHEFSPELLTVGSWECTVPA